MARITPDEAKQVVLETLRANGGTADHDTIVNALTQAGAPQYASLILSMGQNREIVPKVKAQGEGLPAKLTYSLPATVPA